MVRETTLRKLITVFMPKLVDQFNIRELAKRAGISYDSTYRHVKFLVEENIFKERRIGKSVVCNLNLKNIMTRKYLEKISISKTEEFLKKDVVIRSLFGELIDSLKKIAPNELLCVVLYGSYARGTQTEHSDIDLLIIVSTFEVSEKVERECGGIEHRYGRDIAPLITTASEFKKMLESKKRMVAHEIQLDGIVLFGFEKYYMLIAEGISND